MNSDKRLTRLQTANWQSKLLFNIIAISTTGGLFLPKIKMSQPFSESRRDHDSYEPCKEQSEDSSAHTKKRWCFYLKLSYSLEQFRTNSPKSNEQDIDTKATSMNSRYR